MSEIRAMVQLITPQFARTKDKAAIVYECTLITVAAIVTFHCKYIVAYTSSPPSVIPCNIDSRKSNKLKGRELKSLDVFMAGKDPAVEEFFVLLLTEPKTTTTSKQTIEEKKYASQLRPILSKYAQSGKLTPKSSVDIALGKPSEMDAKSFGLLSESCSAKKADNFTSRHV